MRSDKDKFFEEQKFTRRSLLLGGIKFSLFTVLFGRLYYLGGYKNSDYKTLSDDNRIKVQYLLPKRGKITDRNHKILADNIQTYRLVMLPDQVQDIRRSFLVLNKYFPMDNVDIDALIEKIKYKPKFIPSTVIEGLQWQDVCKLEVALRDFTGFFIEQGWMRLYHSGDSIAHIVGYVQAPSKDDYKANPMYRLADFRVGKSGIEYHLDEELRGSYGYKRIEVNAKGKVIRHLENEKSVDGNDHSITIDFELQQYVQDRISAEHSGSCVVMDVVNGEILAINTHPSFDANLFPNGIVNKEWKKLLHNPYGCLSNKAICGLYPPGSLFKMIVVLAALESGAVTPDHHVTCSGFVEVGSHKFHCWHKRGGHGRVEVIRALRESCDVYFYDIAQKTGVAQISKMARRFGFGQLTGIEIPNEKSGLVPDKKWKLGAKGQHWLVGDTVNLGIGQGAMLATPLQLVTMMARIVNPDKQMVSPSLFQRSPEMISSLATMDIQQEYLDIVKEGLDQTVNSPHGLAYYRRILTPGYEMGGKTATCQVKRITLEERKKGILTNEQRVWHHRDHAMFAGYAPMSNPRYAVAVVIEHGGSGGKVAVPIGRDILLKVQKLMKGKG